MAAKREFEDEVLGRVTWDRKEGEWKFDAGPIAGKPIPASFTAGKDGPAPGDPGWDDIRACVRWIRDNEPMARAFITERMFDNWREAWYVEEETEVRTPEGFRDALALDSISFLEDRKAILFYADGDLFCGHSVLVTVDGSGQFEGDPELFG